MSIKNVADTLSLGDEISAHAMAAAGVTGAAVRASLRLRGLDLTPHGINTSRVVATTHAVIDADGHCGAWATVYASGDSDTCRAFICRSGGRMIKIIGASKGDKVHTADVGRIYAEVAA